MSSVSYNAGHEDTPNTFVAVPVSLTRTQTAPACFPPLSGSTFALSDLKILLPKPPALSKAVAGARNQGGPQVYGGLASFSLAPAFVVANESASLLFIRDSELQYECSAFYEWLLDACSLWAYSPGIQVCVLLSSFSSCFGGFRLLKAQPGLPDE